MPIIKILFLVIVFGGLAAVILWKRKALMKFYEEVKFEMTKVTWPTMDEVVNMTILVFIVTFLLAVFCWGADTIFAFLFIETLFT